MTAYYILISDWSSDVCSSDLCALHTVEECPGIRAVEAPDDHRFQEPWIEVAQVHSVPGAGFGFQRFPVGDDAARFAAHVPQRPVAPDVAFRVFGMTLDRYSSDRNSVV